MSDKSVLTIKIPPEAVKYILFQRTEYLFFRRNAMVQKVISFLPRRIAYALESLFSNFDVIVSLEAKMTKKKVQDLFSEGMAFEYENIKSYLPKNPATILDIGCGVAGIDVLLGNHYKKLSLSPSFFLLDKTDMPTKVYYSFKQRGCYYNSLDIAKNLLMGNGILEEKISLKEADGKVVGFDAKFDLVISLISWGFHYPVAIYLDEVYAKMNKGGVLIIDVRKVPQEDGIQLIKNKFGNITIIKESPKSARVVAVKA